MHTYKASGSSFSVGYWSSNGAWSELAELDTAEEAQALVSFLNGGAAPA